MNEKVQDAYRDWLNTWNQDTPSKDRSAVRRCLHVINTTSMRCIHCRGTYRQIRAERRDV